MKLNLPLPRLINWLDRHFQHLLFVFLVFLSAAAFISHSRSGLALAYNDARSHLDIGRRVVEGLKPGLAQLGSVWLPLNHLLMVPTIWHDFFWHTGLAGALQSQLAFVATGILITRYLSRLKVGRLGQMAAVLIFASNLNVLYLQSTAMTELLLLATMTAGCYYLLVYFQEGKLSALILSAFWVMLSTLVRYDGWFLLLFITGLLGLRVMISHGYRRSEGTVLIFLTLAGCGIILWFLWNWLVFSDPLYFALGPFSAHAQQQQLLAAGNLPTKGNIWLSLKIYSYALFYNSYTYPVILSIGGVIYLWRDQLLSRHSRLSALALWAPWFFNILALFLGFSVLNVQGISGDVWFNIRYGMMLIPTIAIFTGLLIDRLKSIRPALIGTLILVLLFAVINRDAVTIDDARVGSSQKNVSEVSGWLSAHTATTPGYILISAASHDAIIFSSGLPMARFIHEGTGRYWQEAVHQPSAWARWIIVRTHDLNDLTWRLADHHNLETAYDRVGSYPFADIYQLKSQYLPLLNTRPVFKDQK